MTVRCRPHHLLCLLTYAGKGYSPAFTGNYDAIAGRISRGEEILIVEGPDDICAPLLAEDDPHCRRERVSDRDGTAAQDIGRLLGLPVAAGLTIKLGRDLLHRMRAAFANGRTRAACAGCEWFQLCSTIAADGYREARIGAPALRVSRSS